MKAIVGLGNPGDQYAHTRHNIGFQVIDAIADSYAVHFKSKGKSLIGTFFLDGEKVLLVKPQTFMNLSGESVFDVVDYYDLDMEDLLIIYDDIDIDVGKMRIRQKGSAGTHNGMRSVIYHLKSDKMARIRLGIGKQDNIPLDKYVLGKFTSDELSIVKETVEKAAKAALFFVKEGINPCMNKYNIR
ncbi:aminoacyl-tRNA hydrolase [Alkalibaculum bacchi]|uniref:aminoacyl-tRNA hydrolase n=1 Tax=Alkalibaculum bacchi TaxID=645887 RepID=UPI0026F13782|nr:aminoacyl-tRNA hydrolase [Alkalibaculum bacchi]